MKGQTEITINAIADLKYGKSLPERERKEGEVPVYGSGGIAGYHNKSYVQKGIIIGRKGTVGSVRFSEKPFFPIDTVFFVDSVKGKHSLKFFYYFLQSIGLANYDSDAAVPGLNRNLVHKLSALIPEPEDQQRIASILSAYDDLIEVNNQRIKVIEETSSQLYKEWFVRMRFPGYKTAKFEKGIPEGWEVKKVNDAFQILGGGTPSTEKEEYWDGNINWFTPTDITGSSSIFLSEAAHRISEKGLKGSSAKLFPPYSIMMTSRATIGAVGINTTEACTNQGFITCLPNESVPFTYLYQWILSNKEQFETFASGSTFLEITKGTFKKINILVPSSIIVSRYHTIAEPLFKQLENLQQQNLQLRQIRDRLLPRLISGKLQVKEIYQHNLPANALS